MNSFRIGTRGSRLALRQAEEVRVLLEAAHPSREFTLVKIGSYGDRNRTTPLVNMGGSGVFVKELENALLEGRIDAAVHSAKDLPSELQPKFSLQAVLKRGYIEDVLISRNGSTLLSLPRGAVLATGSPRRRAFIKHYRSDLSFTEIRGNVETRLEKLSRGKFAGIILARAGLARLGMLEIITEIINSDVCLPAPGQGFIVVQTRSTATEIGEIVSAIDDGFARMCLSAERSLMRTLKAGCSSAIGGFCNYDPKRGSLMLRAAVLDLSGISKIEVAETLQIPTSNIDTKRLELCGTSLGIMVGEKLIERGCRKLLVD